MSSGIILLKNLTLPKRDQNAKAVFVSVRGGVKSTINILQPMIRVNYESLIVNPGGLGDMNCELSIINPGGIDDQNFAVCDCELLIVDPGGDGHFKG